MTLPSGQRVVEVVPHLFRLHLGSQQAYLWNDGVSSTLIDTGKAESGRIIATAVRELGIQPERIERTILTHHHDDHVGSAAEVASWGVPVVAHAADAPVIRGEVEAEPPNFTLAERTLIERMPERRPAPPVEIAVEVHDGDVLEFAGGVEVVSTPGHTDGSIALYFRHHGILVTGDIATQRDREVALGGFNLDSTTAAESFRHLATFDIEVACFGHGEPITRDAGVRLREAAASLRP